MTQGTPAHDPPVELARYRLAGAHSLAQRRAAFAAQMREMALSDLEDVSKRLKSLHRELEQLDGHRWTHYDLAAAMGIRPRTFQSWENGEVENSDGKGYDKMARYYSKRLKRKITRQWILFGDPAEAQPKKAPVGGLGSSERVATVGDLEQQIAALRTELLAEIGKAQASQEAQHKQPSPASRKSGSKRT